MIRAPVDAIRAWLNRRQLAYQYTFGSPSGQRVLRDLAQFCRANETTFHEDARLHAVAEGRREVWLRIQRNIHLTTPELWKQYGAGMDTTKD